MTEKWVFGVSGLLLGTVLGGGLGSFILTKNIRKRVKELEIQNEDLIKENHKANRRIAKLHEKPEEKKKPDEPAKADIVKTEIPFDRASEERRKKEIAKKNIKTDYAKLSEEYHSDAFDEHFEDRVGPTDEDDDDDEDSDLIDDTERDIHRITPEQFKCDLNYRDDESLIYYQEDDVLVDCKNKVIHDQESVIGKECMGMICDTKEDFIYIDNEIEDKLYEIVINHNESFFRDIQTPMWVGDDDDDSN